MKIIELRPLVIVNCKCHASASGSSRHHHSLTIIVEREKKLNPYQNLNTDQFKFLTAENAVGRGSAILNRKSTHFCYGLK